MKLDNEVNFIIETLNNNNFEAFIVGGCVRDIILKREPEDFDVTTNAKPDEVKKLFKKTIDTGIKHGTVTVVLNKKNYEVTTYRIDGAYEDNRHPTEVVYTNNLKEDLLRRDFTMNAIAYHKEIGFVDPFLGIKDIEDKIIRGVGEPCKRFNEDALRMMRAIRFSGQLGFEIEENTLDAIIKNSHLIKNISIERIRDEFIKLILSEGTEKISFISETGLMKYIYMPLDLYLKEKKDFIINSLEISENNIIIRLALFFYCIDFDLYEVLKYFKFDNKTIKSLSVLLRYKDKINTDKYSIRKLLNEIGEELFLNLMEVQRCVYKTLNDINYISDLNNIKKIYKEVINDPLSFKQLAINGGDLISMGYSGKEVGLILNFAINEVLKNPELNEKEKLMSLIDKNINIILQEL